MARYVEFGRTRWKLLGLAAVGAIGLLPISLAETPTASADPWCANSNSGWGNTGCGNSGNGNSGSGNSGNGNSGNGNSGNGNSGNGNSGWWNGWHN